MQIVGHGFDYTYLLAVHTRGGILIAWCTMAWSVSNVTMRIYSVSVMIKEATSESEWWLMVVYGLTRDGEKSVFLDELRSLRQLWSGPWLTAGDFNMIYRVEDKNNDRFNKRLMEQFRRFLNDVSLKELHL
jgi:hypothetical protein